MTTDIWDAAVLSALGLPAITATRLDKATIPEIEELSQQFGWIVDGANSQNDHDTPTECRLRLLVVGWRVSDMDTIEPDGLSDLANLLVEFERHMELDLQDVGIWRPIDWDLERAAFFLKRNDLDSVREVFMDSAKDCCLSVAGFAVPTDESNELVSALQRVLELRDGDIGPHSPAVAIKLFQSAVDRDLVDPLLRRALSTQDPYKRNLTVMAADISRKFFSLMPETASARDHNSVECKTKVREQLDLCKHFLAIMKAMKQKS